MMNLQRLKAALVKFQSLIALFLMCITLSFLSDNFMTSDNAWNVMRQISVNVCISVGMTLVILTAGIDLSVGSILALCGAVTAGLIKNGIEIPGANLYIGFTLFGAMLAGMIVGGGLGYFNGWSITRVQSAAICSNPRHAHHCQGAYNALDRGISNHRIG